LVLPIDPARPGSLEVVARVVDADGTTTSNTTARLSVDPPLNDSVSSVRSPDSSGENLSLAGTVLAGVPPFLWVVAPGATPVNETTPAGILDAPGWFDWSGTYSTEGWTNVSVLVVDAAGSVSTATVDLEAVPPWEGNLSVAPGTVPTPGTFELALSFTGGIPPFSVLVNASDGERWNRTAPSDDPISWNLSAQGSGLLGLQILVLDALGAELEWNRTIDVAPPPATDASSAPPPAPLSTAVAAILLVAALLGAGGYLYRRHRGRAPTVASPDPVAVLRGIIEPADGADRATVELLAEEAGIPLTVVRSTIDRLVGTGTIRSEATHDGEEVVSWVPTPPS
jgi:hypothetical protein